MGVPQQPRRSVPVAIVGAGPVGLALALGLARHGVRSVVLERDVGTSRHSKAAGVHVRTREVLRRWGVEAAFLATGDLVGELTLHDVSRADRSLLSFDFHALADEADRPGLLLIEQSETERLLLEAVRASGTSEVVFGAEVTGLHQSAEESVRLSYRHGGSEQHLDAAFAVGCDGASSFVRQALGLPFEGRTYRLRPMLADVAVDDGRDRLPSPRVHDRGRGMTVGLRLRAGLWRIIHLEDVNGTDDSEVPVDEVRRRAAAVLGPGPVEVVWSSRFRIHRRSSPRFRLGRVLLAGDAAHVHSPVGGQGMNAGIQDASTLAWQLAAVLDGADADRMLGAYDTERRAVVAGSVSRFTDLLTRVYLQSPSWVRRAAFAAQRTAMRVPAVHRGSLRRLSMLDLELPASSPLIGGSRSGGVRLPDPLLRAPDGAERRLHDLLPLGAALLRITHAERTDDVRAADLPGVEAQLRIGGGGYADPSGALRSLLGGADGWILVRPDGYVAWARTQADGLGRPPAPVGGRHDEDPAE
jgi:2-polyprenyl-6-methoxyphenol hydroxylase-like FAD-dependent oxidoreductase